MLLMMFQYLASFSVTRKVCSSLKSSVSWPVEDNNHVPHQPGPETFGSVYLSQWASLMNECPLLWKRRVLHLPESLKKESENVSSPGHQYWYSVKASTGRHPSARSLPRPHVTPPPRRWRSLSQILRGAEDLSPAWSASLEKQGQVGDLTPIAVKHLDFQNRLFPYSSCRHLPVNCHLPIKQPRSRRRWCCCYWHWDQAPCAVSQESCCWKYLFFTHDSKERRWSTEINRA